MREFIAYLPSLIAVLTTLTVMVLSYRVVRLYWERSINRDVLNGVFQFFLFVIGVTTTILLLPVEQTTRENILTVGGLILTGIVAFSSTTVIRDAAAGITLRIISPFTRGDYLQTDSVFGRISEIGFFYTEVQTEDRSLVTLMNSNLLSKDFRTIPSSGTLLSTEVSIGYDLSRDGVESALLEAAEIMELEGPFVHVRELGNFAVTYRVAGLFKDFENLVTARSDFRKIVLDTLHSNDIEIVSPDFLNRRNVEKKRFIPEEIPPAALEEEGDVTTEVIFEKALEAQEIEKMDELLTKLEEKKEEYRQSDEDKSDALEALDHRIEAVKRRQQTLEEEMNSEA